METTANGALEGYKHHEIKEVGADLVSVSMKFYERLMETIEGKEVVFRVTPRATELSEQPGQYRFYARVHTKD